MPRTKYQDTYQDGEVPPSPTYLRIPHWDCESDGFKELPFLDYPITEGAERFGGICASRWCSGIILHARFFLLELACETVTLYYPSYPEGGLLFKHTGCLYILDLLDFGSFRVHISIALKDMTVAGAIATPSSASCY